MREIGEMLRNAREACGMTLDEVEQITKIRRRYLEAIERGDAAAIPGEVYLKGFIRNFAEAVGLDADEVLAQYRQLRGTSSPREREAGASTDGPTAEMEIVVVEQPSGSRRAAIVVSVIVVILVAVAAVAVHLLSRGNSADMPGGTLSQHSLGDTGTPLPQPSRSEVGSSDVDSLGVGSPDTGSIGVGSADVGSSDARSSDAGLDKPNALTSGLLGQSGDGRPLESILTGQDLSSRLGSLSGTHLSPYGEGDNL